MKKSSNFVYTQATLFIFPNFFSRKLKLKLVTMILICRYNMTQHIKTHFKSRGINSLANNPATLAAFLNQNRSTLSNYQIPEDMINSLATNQEGFVTEDMDTNRYEDELNGSSANLTNHSLASEHDNTKDESQEEIDPC